MLYHGSMTPAQLKLLKSVAEGKIAELRMGIASIDEAFRSHGLPEQDKAFLSMQRGQLLAALQDILEAYDAVMKETQGSAGGR